MRWIPDVMEHLQHCHRCQQVFGAIQCNFWAIVLGRGGRQISGLPCLLFVFHLSDVVNCSRKWFCFLWLFDVVLGMDFFKSLIHAGIPHFSFYLPSSVLKFAFGSVCADLNIWVVNLSILLQHDLWFIYLFLYLWFIYLFLSDY